MRNRGRGAVYVAIVTVVFAASVIPAFSQTAARVSDPGAAKTSSTDEVSLLKRQVAEQQKEIEALQATMKAMKEKIDQGTSAALPASPQAPNLGQVASTTPVIPTAPKGPAVASNPPVISALTGPISVSPQAESKGAAAKAPLTLRIGDADFTLGGFADATVFFRSTNLGSGIGSSFGAAPFSNTTAGRLTETRFTAQNSRVSLLGASQVGENNVRGYVEADFLGIQPGNGFVTSNSNSLRMRLYWVDVNRGKFEFLGGQSWSMLTPNRTGLSPVPGDIFYSQDMDTNYQVGLTWARQTQFRFIYHPTEHLAAGISLENPQQFVGSAAVFPNTSGAVVLPSAAYVSQVDVNQSLSGVGGANTTNAAGQTVVVSAGATSTPNLHPDVIGKIAYDETTGGKHMHVEVAGLVSSFKLFNPSSQTTSSVTGGGGSLHFNLEVTKNLLFILTSFYSDGGGRYIFGLGPDFIVKPDGSPSLVHASSGIAGFEWQATPKTMYYGYYGGAYFQRNTALDPATGKFLGFGFPGSASSANRAIQEPTFGIIQTFWKNPRYGALQLITQYSYMTRHPWSVSAGAPKNAHLSMGYANVRYVLP